MGTDDMNELEPEEPTFEQASQEAPTSEAREEHEPAPRPAYVREPRHHKSQPPVNDVQADETYDNQYSHESGYTLSTRNRMSRGAYRSARSQETKVRQVWPVPLRSQGKPRDLWLAGAPAAPHDRNGRRRGSGYRDRRVARRSAPPVESSP